MKYKNILSSNSFYTVGCIELYWCHKQSHMLLTYLIFALLTPLQTNTKQNESKWMRKKRKHEHWTFWKNDSTNTIFRLSNSYILAGFVYEFYLCNEKKWKEKKMPQTLEMFHVLNTSILQLVYFRGGCAKKDFTSSFSQIQRKNRTAMRRENILKNDSKYA